MKPWFVPQNVCASKLEPLVSNPPVPSCIAGGGAKFQSPFLLVERAYAQILVMRTSDVLGAGFFQDVLGQSRWLFPNRLIDT